jgi:hypothetical protein
MSGMGHDRSKTLADYGVTKDRSSRWQKLAAIPEPEFEAALAGSQKPTTAGIIWAEAPAGLPLVRQLVRAAAGRLPARPRPEPSAQGRGWALVDDVGAPRGAGPSAKPMMGPDLTGGGPA